MPWRGRRRVAGLAAELEDQNVINEGYLSSAECNALVVSACRAPHRKVTRLVRPPAGADDHTSAVSQSRSARSVHAGNGGEDAESESGRLRTQERQVGLMNVELRTGAESRGLRARS